MKKVNKVFLVLVLLISHFSFGQDSLKISASEFISVVKNYHPLAIKYQLQNKIAKEE